MRVCEFVWLDVPLSVDAGAVIGIQKKLIASRLEDLGFDLSPQGLPLRVYDVPARRATRYEQDEQ